MTFIVSSVWWFDFLMLFSFLKQEYHMHQSHPCHSSPLMNADMLNGDCISVLEYRSVALSVVGRERAPCQNCVHPILLCFSPIPVPYPFGQQSCQLVFIYCSYGKAVMWVVQAGNNQVTIIVQRKTFKNPGGYYSLSESPLTDTLATIILPGVNIHIHTERHFHFPQYTEN